MKKLREIKSTDGKSLYIGFCDSDSDLVINAIESNSDLRKADFSGLILTVGDVSNYDFSYTNWKGCALIDSFFSNCNFNRSVFSEIRQGGEVEFNDCTFVGSDIEGLYDIANPKLHFSNCIYMEKKDTSTTSIFDRDGKVIYQNDSCKNHSELFNEALKQGVSFRNADFSGWEIDGELVETKQILDKNFAGSLWSGSTVKNINFINCSFSSALMDNNFEMKRTSFSQCSFLNAHLKDGTIDTGRFYHCIYNKMTIENLANLKSTEFVHDANIYDFKMNNCQTIDSVFVFKGLASKMDFTGTNFYNCTMTSHDERLTFHDTKFSGLMMGCTFPDKTLFFNCQVDSHIVNTKFKDAVFQQTKGDMVLCEKTMSFSNNKISISSDSQLPNVRMLASEIEQVVSKNISKGMKM